MRKIMFFLVFLSVVKFGQAQMETPVKWTFSAKKLDASRYEIHLTAAIEKGWHIYSQSTPDGGPVPTSISFSKNPLLTLEGSANEVGKLEQHNEPLFGVDVKQFSNKLDLVQVVKLKGKVKTSLSGKVDFMVCNNQECLPPSSVKFSVPIK